MSSNEQALIIGAIGGVEGVEIWGDKTKAELLFGAVEEKPSSGRKEVSVTRPAGVVKRYPGDPRPYTRKGSTYTYSLFPARSAQTTPGSPFWIEVPVDLLPGQKRDVYQFTSNAGTGELADTFRRVVSTPLIFRSNSGKAIEITPIG